MVAVVAAVVLEPDGCPEGSLSGCPEGSDQVVARMAGRMAVLKGVLGQRLDGLP